MAFQYIGMMIVRIAHWKHSKMKKVSFSCFIGILNSFFFHMKYNCILKKQDHADLVCHLNIFTLWRINFDLVMKHF